jgi:L-fuculose-phosphate aldolase
MDQRGVYMNDFLYYRERANLARTMKLLFDRKLTNSAGGNAAVRLNDQHMIITPSKMSENKHCEITPEDILVCDYDLNIIDGNGVLSREATMHQLLLRNIPEINASIHAHPEYVMVFAAANKVIKSVTEATQKMGDCELVEQAKAYSKDLAENVLKFFQGKRHLLNITGLGGLLPYHGIVAVGKSLEQAFSVIERIEWDARCNIFGKLI